MHIRLVLGLTAALLTACSETSGAGEAPEAEHVGTYVWRSDLDGFAGLSAIEYDPGTRALLALSDRGAVFSGTVRWEGERIAGVDDLTGGRLKGTDGATLPAARVDSEGLARGPDGRLYVSFELKGGVWSYDDILGPARPLPMAPAFRNLQVNSGLEALAVAPDGDILTLPERSGELNRPFPVFRYRDGTWDQPYEIPRVGAYLPVGADFGPDGRLYLLERRFLGVFGFSSRVRRFDYGPDGLGDGDTIILSRTGAHDNLEGISVWRGEDGALRILMVSDDNGVVLQQTELVLYRLTE